MKKIELDILYEIPDVCAWIGKKNPEGLVINAIPFFVEGSTPTSRGLVLLSDLARQIHLENKIGNKFSVPNKTQVYEDIKQIYGDFTINCLNATYLTNPLTTDTRDGLARYLFRTFKVNFADVGGNLEVDRNKIRIKQPYTKLLSVPSGLKFENLDSLASYLSSSWDSMTQVLSKKLPVVQTRQEIFDLLQNQYEPDTSNEFSWSSS
jgi:hypothetical protein